MVRKRVDIEAAPDISGSGICTFSIGGMRGIVRLASFVFYYGILCHIMCSQEIAVRLLRLGDARECKKLELPERAVCLYVESG